jgi:hypothetical protein
VGSLALRPDDSLTLLRMAWSVGFLRFVSSTDATYAQGHLAFTPVGLSSTEHASLRWTYSFAKTPQEPEIINWWRRARFSSCNLA